MTDDPQAVLSQVVTQDLVEGWKGQRMDLATELSAAQQKIAPLQTKIRQMDALLKAAAPFIPGLQEWLNDQSASNPNLIGEDSTEDVPLTVAIKNILATRRLPVGRLTSRDRIKMGLPGAGYALDKINANPNYLYTALKRLVDRGEIVEPQPGHFRLT